MQCLEYSKRRLNAFLEEIERLKSSEFPYLHSEHALGLIESHFSGYLTQLKKHGPKSNPATVRAACAAELTGLFEYLPLLGFILRSTNPRNAFEVYGPLLRLAREIVKPTVKLIISSEWDYSPLTYLGITHLPDYVLIGLPAHESGNPLLLPLAGHELGHSVWVAEDLETKFGPLIDAKVVGDIKMRWTEYSPLFPEVTDPRVLDTDFFAQLTWSPAAAWAIKQAEETFCDFVGLWIFGESYLHAFAYLLAPKQLWVRPVLYPNLAERVDNLTTAAADYGIAVPTDYKGEFEDLKTSFDKQQEFLLSLADAASSAVTDQLQTEVQKILTSRLKNTRNKAKVDEIFQDFEIVAPATNAGSIADILNAGWRAFHDDNLWKEVPQIQSKEATLNELILKSLQVYEYEQLLKVPI
jgi:hypothetical protein